MASIRKLKNIDARNVLIFKIVNRRGFAALCRGNLTEGTTPLAAYARMQKAAKRMGLALKDITAAQAKKLVKQKV